MRDEIEALRRALEDEGPNPVIHRKMRVWLEKHWPTLWRAIVNLLGAAPAEREEREALAVLREALNSFKCTQPPEIYPADHWCHRASRLLAAASREQWKDCPKCDQFGPCDEHAKELIAPREQEPPPHAPGCSLPPDHRGLCIELPSAPLREQKSESQADEA